MSSRKLARPLNARKTMLGCGRLRWSLSHVWNESRCAASEFHVNDAGHGTSFRQPKYEITIPSTTATTRPARPRHHGRGAGAATARAAGCATAIKIGRASCRERGEELEV